MSGQLWVTHDGEEYRVPSTCQYIGLEERDGKLVLACRCEDGSHVERVDSGPVTDEHVATMTVIRFLRWCNTCECNGMAHDWHPEGTFPGIVTRYDWTFRP